MKIINLYYFGNFKTNIETLLEPYFEPIFDKMQASPASFKTLSVTFPIATNLQHYHSTFRPRFPRQINCMHVYCAGASLDEKSWGGHMLL